QQSCRPILACERGGAVDFDHGQPPAGGSDGVAFSAVRLLPNAQWVQPGLKRVPIDDFGDRSVFFVLRHDRLLLVDEWHLACRSSAPALTWPASGPELTSAAPLQGPAALRSARQREWHRSP